MKGKKGVPGGTAAPQGKKWRLRNEKKDKALGEGRCAPHRGRKGWSKRTGLAKCIEDAHPTCPSPWWGVGKSKKQKSRDSETPNLQ